MEKYQRRPDAARGNTRLAEILLDYIAKHGLSIREIERQSGMSRDSIQRLLTSTNSLTARNALLLLAWLLEIRGKDGAGDAE